MSNCIFCDLINSNANNIIVNKENFVIIKDINPDAKIHLLAIPKRHFQNIYDANNSDFITLCDILKYIQSNAQNLGITEGCRIVINNGKIATQTHFHAHIHILGGQELKHMQKN